MDYYAEPDPDPDPQPPSQRRGGSSILIGAVVVLVLAAGGGAYAVVSSLTGNSTGGHPSSQPTSSAPTQPASSGLATTPSARSTATASPSASPKKSAKPSTVAVSPSAAAHPAAARVRTLLERYFAAINAHDYAAYNSLLDAQMQQQNPQAKFASGYATTRDSAAKLTSIADIGGGSLAATVTFTSHQSPADSINNSSCTAWTITLYLQPQGGSYLISVPPPGYQSVHQDCP